MSSACCTVFTPRHPQTRPKLEEIAAEEAKADRLPELEDAAVRGATLYEIKGDTVAAEAVGMPEAGFYKPEPYENGWREDNK